MALDIVYSSITHITNIMSPKANIIRGEESLALDHEEQDFERVVKCRLAGNFDDWPNEAGVIHPVQLAVSGIGY